MTATQLPTAQLSRKMVVFRHDVDPDLWRGRDSIRRIVLAMVPDESAAPIPRPPDDLPDGGTFWGIQGANGLTLVLSTHEGEAFADIHAEVNDLLARSEDLAFHRVLDPDTGRRSLWVCLDDEIVLVAAQTWRRDSAANDRRIQRALRPPSGQDPVLWAGTGALKVVSPGVGPRTRIPGRPPRRTGGRSRPS